MRRPSGVGYLLLGLSCTSAGCGGTVPPNQTAGVTRSERIWVDATRRTPANGTFRGMPTRTLRTLIWQPASAGTWPIVVMAHGFGVLPEDFDAFARSVAAAGFILAAPAFPLTNQNAPGGQLGFNDLVNQPGDLSFVVSQLLEATDTKGDPLEGRIVPAAVAALGQSLGAATVIGLTRKNCCRDARIRASVLSAAPLLPVFGPDPISAAGPPTLILHGTADMTVGYVTATQLYGMIDPPRFLVGLLGAGHADAIESQAEPPIPARDAGQHATIAFLNAVLHGADAELDAALATLAAEGNLVQADPGSSRSGGVPRGDYEVSMPVKPPPKASAAGPYDGCCFTESVPLAPSRRRTIRTCSLSTRSRKGASYQRLQQAIGTQAGRRVRYASNGSLKRECHPG